MTLLKKNQRIEIGYKDGVKYWVKIQKLQLPPKKIIKSIISTLLEDRDSDSRKDTGGSGGGGGGGSGGTNTSLLSEHNYHLVIQYENDKSKEKVPYHFFLFRYVNLFVFFSMNELQCSPFEILIYSLSAHFTVFFHTTFFFSTSF